LKDKKRREAREEEGKGTGRLSASPHVGGFVLLNYKSSRRGGRAPEVVIQRMGKWPNSKIGKPLLSRAAKEDTGGGGMKFVTRFRVRQEGKEEESAEMGGKNNRMVLLPQHHDHLEGGGGA